MAILAVGSCAHQREINQRKFHCGRCSMKIDPSPRMFSFVNAVVGRCGFSLPYIHLKRHKKFSIASASQPVLHPWPAPAPIQKPKSNSFRRPRLGQWDRHACFPAKSAVAHNFPPALGEISGRPRQFLVPPPQFLPAQLNVRPAQLNVRPVELNPLRG